MKENPRKILLIGGEGNMGRRYQAILNDELLNLKYKILEKKSSADLRNKLIREATHIIITTPTKTHISILKEIHDIKKMKRKNKGTTFVLCEKPISNKLSEVKKIVELYNKDYLHLSMVNNYYYMFEGKEQDSELKEYSLYDYFKTGDDGLYYDCIQIIGYHKGDLSNLYIDNSSAFWLCTINGIRLNPDDIDFSYYNMLKYFLQKRIKEVELRDISGDKLIEFHRKVEEYIKCFKKN